MLNNLWPRRKKVYQNPMLLWRSNLIITSSKPASRTSTILFGMRSSTSTSLNQATFQTSLLMPLCSTTTQKQTPKPSCLGKVRLTNTSFVPFSDALILHYPLESIAFFLLSNESSPMTQNSHPLSPPLIQFLNPQTNQSAKIIQTGTEVLLKG